MLNYSRVAHFFMQRFRRKRLAHFRDMFPPEQLHTILDVGGTPDIWDALKYPCKITLLNSDTREVHSANGYHVQLGDGRALPFHDRAFDLAFSNSVIEHVGGWEDMQRFASELRRVGHSYYCQTPNKWFPIEPHLGTLFLHWWPWLLNHYFVIRHFTLWGLLNKPTGAIAAKSLSEIRLLTRRELESLFPDAQIFAERFLFMPKSYTAFRHCPVQRRLTS
jgi:hypothetical protein